MLLYYWSVRAEIKRKPGGQWGKPLTKHNEPQIAFASPELLISQGQQIWKDKIRFRLMYTNISGHMTKWKPSLLSLDIIHSSYYSGSSLGLWFIHNSLSCSAERRAYLYWSSCMWYFICAFTYFTGTTLMTRTVHIPLSRTVVPWIEEQGQ